ncbi:hypothetical protein MVEN_00699000 [Mycena venus]|uniref:Uncharacterized protein n=1 Tax=Mycena venus TaxID=2733690 RepID=A0A8H7D5N8_9AGAR|nr:hypothetical protein MVEN_00699000 [Mycena venus]
MQQWEINELKAKVRALQAASTDSSPSRLAAPAAKNVIEILDDEETNSGEQSGGLERDASRTDRLLHPAPSPEQAKVGLSPRYLTASLIIPPLAFAAVMHGLHAHRMCTVVAIAGKASAACVTPAWGIFIITSTACHTYRNPTGQAPKNT